MKSNSETDSTVKYILVQLPEETSNPSFPTICDIGKNRINKIGDKLKLGNQGLENLDIGFKVFKLDSSNIKEWDGDTAMLKDLIDYKENNPIDYKKYVEKLRESDNAFNVDTMTDNQIATKILEYYLESHIENIKSDRTNEDLLYEILLKYGLDLTLPIEEKVINGKAVYVIGFGALVVCLDNEITIDIVEEIAKLKEEYQSEIMRVVFKDSSFKDAVVKTNAIQVLKQFGINEVVSV